LCSVLTRQFTDKPTRSQ